MNSILMYYLLFGFWGCFFLRDISLILGCGAIFLFFLWQRFSKQSLFLIPLIVLSILLLHPYQDIPTPGIYTVYEIHAKYALARKESSSLLLYGLENVDFYDEVKVSYVDKIESLKNTNLFDFQAYMYNQGITSYSMVNDGDIVRKSDSIKARLFRVLKKDVNNLRYFYGIYEEGDMDTMFASLGVGFISFIQIVKRLFRKKIPRNTLDSFCLCLSILHGVLFSYSPILIRFILYQGMKKVCEDRHKHLCVVYFLFILLLPSKATSFVCTFPFCIQWLFLMEKDASKRKWESIVLILGIEFLYFHKADLFSLVLFRWGRVLFGLGYGIKCLSFILPFFSKAGIWIDLLIKNLPSYTFYYVPSIIFCVCWFMSFIRKKKTIWIILLICCACLESSFDPFFHIYMLNIGQGDCTLLVEPYQRSAILIDCGQSLNRDNVVNIVLPFLKMKQIRKLDYVIGTHDDFDRNGGIEHLVEVFPVNKVLLKAEKNIVSYPFIFLLENRESMDENDASLITYFSYDGFDYLWTGDASTFVEEQLFRTYDLSGVDVFKLGHHGSKTSTSLAFLEAMHPKLGLISVAKKNYYGHPSSEVIARCIQMGVNLLQTKDVGTIHLFSLPHILFFSCTNGYCGIVSMKGLESE
ncbi:MAG: MBL fold metallo-hydrolase [Bacillota bacterium]|nr:MBL fold metallo-hydrolase [Bacillota bacterium]